MTRPTWEQTRDAIQAAISTASGLTTIWGFQNVDAPAHPYVELSFGRITQIGQDFIDETYDAHGTAGSEVELAVKGVREVTLNITVFSAKAVDSSNTAADAMAEIIRGKLLLPTIRSQMAAVGVTPFDPSNINNIPAIIKVGFRGRALLEVRCYIPAIIVAEYTTYIEHVTGDLTVDGGPPQGEVIPLVIA